MSYESFGATLADLDQLWAQYDRCVRSCMRLAYNGRNARLAKAQEEKRAARALLEEFYREHGTLLSPADQI